MVKKREASSHHEAEGNRKTFRMLVMLYKLHVLDNSKMGMAISHNGNLKFVFFDEVDTYEKYADGEC